MAKTNNKDPLYFGGIKTVENNTGEKYLEIILYIKTSDVDELFFTSGSNYDPINYNNKRIRANSLNCNSNTNNVCNLSFDFYYDTISPNENTDQTLFRLEIEIPLNLFSNCNYDFFKLTIKGYKNPTDEELSTRERKCHKNNETEEGIIIFEPPPDIL